MFPMHGTYELETTDLAGSSGRTNGYQKCEEEKEVFGEGGGGGGKP